MQFSVTVLAQDYRTLYGLRCYVSSSFVFVANNGYTDADRSNQTDAGRFGVDQQIVSRRPVPRPVVTHGTWECPVLRPRPDHVQP